MHFNPPEDHQVEMFSSDVRLDDLAAWDPAIAA